jgi:hypothetical protein
MLRFPVSSEMKPTFTTMVNECGVYLSIVHSMKVPTDEIQSCFLIYANIVSEPQLSYIDAVSTHLCSLTVQNGTCLEKTKLEQDLKVDW